MSPNLIRSTQTLASAVARETVAVVDDVRRDGLGAAVLPTARVLALLVALAGPAGLAAAALPGLRGAVGAGALVELELSAGSPVGVVEGCRCRAQGQAGEDEDGAGKVHCGCDAGKVGS